MLFDAPAVLPPPDEHPDHLDRLLDHLTRARSAAPAEVLADFLDAPADPATLGVAGVHHVAAYTGDYRREEDFDAWLASVASHGAVRDVRTGPSHIAPRRYGTPGHWINLTVDGHEYELFSCRAHGEWTGYDARRKNALMSHHGLSVAGPRQVRAVLDFLGARPGVEQIAFAPADELGHTYGHLLNTRSELVLEIVHAGDPAPAAQR